ncbi:MAG TPA: LamG domain-containing protein, partial [Planctomycetota bacterium]|nr:LamG domain-containing protein [Planctomycetota bacterium]
MGYEIVYCASCQMQVRGADLEKHQAIRVDDLAYCTKCAPAILKSLPLERVDEVLGRVPSPPPLRKGSTSRIAKVQSKTSGRLKAQPAAPPPPAARPSPRKGLLIASGAGAAVLVVLVIIVMSSGGSAPAPREKATDLPRQAPVPVDRPKPAETLAAAQALVELEQLAASPVDPLEVLIRCDEIKSVVRGTPQEAKWKAIQDRATEAKKIRDADQAITLGLEQVRSLRRFDVRFEKKAEIDRLLERMKSMGGPRQGEVQKVIEEYSKDVAEAAVRFKDLVAWYRFSIAERLGRDDSGRENNSISADGVSWNGSFPDGGAGARFSGSGVIAIPVPVREDFTIAFWVRSRQAAVGDNQWFQGPGLVDAEVPGVVDDFGTALLRGKFAFGVGNPDVTLISRTPINDGRWRHAAATRDSRSGEMKIFVDGVAEGSMSGPKGPRSAPNRMVIGGLQTGALSFVGEMDDVRFYSRVLPDAEVAALAQRKDG